MFWPIFHVVSSLHLKQRNEVISVVNGTIVYIHSHWAISECTAVIINDVNHAKPLSYSWCIEEEKEVELIRYAI